MSIRVHKVLGYGGRHPNWGEAFKYLDRNSHPGEVNALLQKAILDCGQEHEEYFGLRMQANGDSRYPRTFLDIVRYADHPDNDDGYVVIVPPAHAHTWFRFDDDIDYQEDCLEPDTKIHWLKRPIYPYIGYMNAKTGQRVKDYDPIQARLLRESESQDVVPVVPYVVQLIAEHVRFPNKLNLHPMIVTWWC